MPRTAGKSARADTGEMLEFRSMAEWEAWLGKNHAASTGVWIRFFKKGSGSKGVTVPEALDVALCYGWITGQARPSDEASWLGRFVPRRPKSIWSKINVGHAERLIREGRMKPAGLKQVEEARKDGRWARAYNPPSKATVPEDFLRELGKNEKAFAFFRTLDKANVYSVVFRLENTKSSEARRKKIAELVRKFEDGEKFH